MKRRKIIVIFAMMLFSVAMFASCRHASTAVLELKENPTTGYSWECTCDSSIAVGWDYQGFKTEKPIDGAGGIKTFTLKPSKDGNFHVVFKYARSWEDDCVALIEYDLVVKDGKITEETAFAKGYDETPHFVIK